MEEITQCPKCKGEYVYFDGVNLYICPECHFEFTKEEYIKNQEEKIVKDANGNPIEDGDTLVVIQDIKLDKTNVIKQGTKAKNVRVLEEPVNGHELECSIDGMGRIYILAKYVKK